jgi:hypothetical protein
MGFRRYGQPLLTTGVLICTRNTGLTESLVHVVARAQKQITSWFSRPHTSWLSFQCFQWALRDLWCTSRPQICQTFRASSMDRSPIWSAVDYIVDCQITTVFYPQAYLRHGIRYRHSSTKGGCESTCFCKSKCNRAFLINHEHLKLRSLWMLVVSFSMLWTRVELLATMSYE